MKKMKGWQYCLLVIVSTLLFISSDNGWLMGLSRAGHASAQLPTLETEDAINLASLSGDRLATFLEADRRYRQGDVVGAENLYRQVKPAFSNASTPQIVTPLYDVSELSSANLAYWNAAQSALSAGNGAGAVTPLEQLVKNEPGFILGYVELADVLQKNGRGDDAIAVLDQGATLHPSSAEIIMAQVKALSDAGQHIEASIAAREFAVLNPDHPQAQEFSKLAEEELNTFLSSVRTNNILGGAFNIVTNIFFGRGNPWDSWDNAIATYEIIELALSDEKEFGARAAEQYKNKLPLETNPEIVEYVTQLGLEMARPMGRDFDYEFFVVKDSSMNAFALPGGKIFVNTGAIAATNSQAELAGILAHEVSHSVLSHGMQKIFANNILAQLQDEIPLGEFLTTMVSLDYSRQQERQSDILGTRVLATSGYAADGLRNFMATLAQNSQAGSPLDEYFSTHPVSASRVSYLEELIQRNGYNRYALEGVDKHREIQAML